MGIGNYETDVAKWDNEQGSIPPQLFGSVFFQKLLAICQNIVHRTPESYRVLPSLDKHGIVGSVRFRPDKIIKERRKEYSFRLYHHPTLLVHGVVGVGPGGLYSEISVKFSHLLKANLTSTVKKT